MFLVPGLWVVAASLRRPGLPPPATIEWLPDPVAWSNYARIFEVLPLARYLANSLLVTGLAVPLTVLVASWAGFAMAQLPARVRHALLALAVMVRMVPLTAVWLTRFLVLRELGLSDSMWALLAPVSIRLEPVLRADLLLVLPPLARGDVRGGPAGRPGSGPHLGVDRDAARPPGHGRRRRS